jgi:hypothetical protein
MIKEVPPERWRDFLCENTYAGFDGVDIADAHDTIRP